MAEFKPYLILGVYRELLKISYYYAESATPETIFFPKMAHKYDELEPIIEKINKYELHYEFDYKEIIHETDKVLAKIREIEENR